MLSKIDKSSGLFVAAAVVFFWIGGALTTFAPPMLDASWARPAPGLKDHASLAQAGDAESALITRGRAIYVREGCWYCHTQQTRTIEADTVRYGWRGVKSPVSTPDEFVYDAPHLFGEILPRFVEVQLYQAILESIASEHSARMVAMRNATDNAKDLTRDLTLSYNKTRQANITKEVSEIASGAAALAE